MKLEFPIGSRYVRSREYAHTVCCISHPGRMHFPKGSCSELLQFCWLTCPRRVLETYDRLPGIYSCANRATQSAQMDIYEPGRSRVAPVRVVGCFLTSTIKLLRDYAKITPSYSNLLSPNRWQESTPICVMNYNELICLQERASFPWCWVGYLDLDRPPDTLLETRWIRGKLFTPRWSSLWQEW